MSKIYHQVYKLFINNYDTYKYLKKVKEVIDI